MVFNPLFIQKQSFEEGKSVLKPSKLQNSTYIFSDIIKVYASDDQEAADGQLMNSPLGAAISGASSKSNGTQTFVPAAGQNANFINNYTQSLGVPSAQTATAKISFPPTVTTTVPPMNLPDDQASAVTTAPAPGNAMELLGKMDTKPSAMLVNPSLYLGQVNGGEILQNTISGIQAYLLNDGKTAEDYSATAPQTQAPGIGQNPVTDNVIKTGSVATAGVDAFTFENFTATPLPGTNTAGQGITVTTAQGAIANLLTAVDKNVNNQTLVPDGTAVVGAKDSSEPTVQSTPISGNTTSDEAKPVSTKEGTNIPAVSATSVDAQAAIAQTVVAQPISEVQTAGQQPIAATVETTSDANIPTVTSDNTTTSTMAAPVKAGKPARPAQRVTTAQKPTSVNEATAVKGKAKAGKTVQPAILPAIGNQPAPEGEKIASPENAAATTQMNLSATAAMPQQVPGVTSTVSTIATAPQSQAAGQMKQQMSATPVVNTDAPALNVNVEASKTTQTGSVTSNNPVLHQNQDTSTGNLVTNSSTPSVKDASKETTVASGELASDPNPVQPENSLKELFGDELKKAGEELLKNNAENKSTASQSAAPTPQPEFKTVMPQQGSEPVLSTEQKPVSQQTTLNGNPLPQTETVASQLKPETVEQSVTAQPKAESNIQPVSQQNNDANFPVTVPQSANSETHGPHVADIPLGEPTDFTIETPALPTQQAAAQTEKFETKVADPVLEKMPQVNTATTTVSLPEAPEVSAQDFETPVPVKQEPVTVSSYSDAAGENINAVPLESHPAAVKPVVENELKQPVSAVTENESTSTVVNTDTKAPLIANAKPLETPAVAQNNAAPAVTENKQSAASVQSNPVAEKPLPVDAEVWMVESRVIQESKEQSVPQAKQASVRDDQVVSDGPATVRTEASVPTPKITTPQPAQPKAETSAAKPGPVLHENAVRETAVNTEPVTKEQVVSSPSPKAQSTETTPAAQPKTGSATVVKNQPVNTTKQADVERPEIKQQDNPVPLTVSGKKATQVTSPEAGAGERVVAKADSENAPVAVEKENIGVRSGVNVAAAPVQPEIVKAKHSDVEKNDVVSSAKAGTRQNVSDNSPANDGEKKDSGAKAGQNAHQPVAAKVSAQENTDAVKVQGDDASSVHKEDTPRTAASVTANTEPATVTPRESGIGQIAEIKNKAQAANPEPKQSAAETIYKNLKPTEILRELHATILSQDKQRVVYNLEPESLGKMRLLLETTQSSVSAHIEVESEAARQSVEANMQQLRQSLQQDGMQNVAIQISLKNPDQKQQRNGSQKKSTQAVGQPSFENDDEQTAEKRLGYNTYEYLA